MGVAGKEVFRGAGWWWVCVKAFEVQDQGSNFILWAMGSHASGAGSVLDEEKTTPVGMGVWEKEAQWSSKEAWGQVCPPVPLCVGAI